MTTDNQEKEGYIIDFISGASVKATPEEIHAVQVFSRQLVEDYGYSKTQIQTRPQWRVKVKPSDVNKEYPVDIMVFSSDKKDDDHEYIIVECKRKDRDDGIGQLKDYLRFSTATLGVWFNGEKRAFVKKTEIGGKIIFEDIPNIPLKGQKIEEVGKFKRKDLTVPHNLQLIFRTIRNTLAGSAIKVTRDEEVAKQLINIVLCKIYDEKFTKMEDMVTFRASISESPDEVKTRIDALFSTVKTKYPEVLDVSDQIDLDSTSVKYVIGELQNYSLTNSPRDAVAEAFESFIGYALKGEQGQFFTPRNIIQLAVEVIDPKPGELIIDPACGSGGFLVESLRHIWIELEKTAKIYGWNESALNEEKVATAIKAIRGIEKDEFLSKVAKAYMAIVGDGKGGIFCENSLENPSNWKPVTQQNITLGKFDVVLTNPPFGQDIRVVGDSILKQYDLAYKWKKSGELFVRTNDLESDKPPQILFIERCLQLLRDGGRLAIVLSETFFHAPNSRYVMQFIKKNNITWIIDLPHNTFRPHNNAKCLILILQKNVQQQDYINMAVAEEMGHNHQGKVIYRWDYTTKSVNKNEIWDDIPLIINELKSNKNIEYTFQIQSQKAHKEGVYVPRYYWKTRDKEIEKIAADENLELVPISQLIKEKVISFFDGHGSPPAENKGMGEIPYIRVKDIVNWEVYKDSTSKIPLNVYNDMINSNKILIEGDILYVRRGSYRIGSVAMVSPFDKEVLLTREILVLRVNTLSNKYNINPYYLLYLLSHRLVAMQAYNKVLIETDLPPKGIPLVKLELPVF